MNRLRCLFFFVAWFALAFWGFPLSGLARLPHSEGFPLLSPTLTRVWGWSCPTPSSSIFLFLVPATSSWCYSGLCSLLFPSVSDSLGSPFSSGPFPFFLPLLAALLSSIFPLIALLWCVFPCSPFPFFYSFISVKENLDSRRLPAPFLESIKNQKYKLLVEPSLIHFIFSSGILIQLGSLRGYTPLPNRLWDFLM